MFRITTEDTATAFVMKVEGCLSGAWVAELEASWRKTTKTLDGRPLFVDLREVLWVDEAGRDLLTLMQGAGVAFVARGCAMRELMREISEAADPGRRN